MKSSTDRCEGPLRNGSHEDVWTRRRRPCCLQSKRVSSVLSAKKPFGALKSASLSSRSSVQTKASDRREDSP
ncbi:hypothetical protein QR680_002265 [Steinernema hermaphroditum]|uniref:Uncharacterized protein n=1 Tax=Steinernema hermaphroditum TaxID=289476 RepID=A0AA39H214_9BILA|nr:hypothetical protein QR680_002265 [Steinernema hermaphroditum]